MSESAASIVNGFYKAFSERHAEVMASLYADDATFSDPVFPRLVGGEIGMMWKMLCERSKEIKIEWVIMPNRGEATIVHWQAWYPFTKTGRRVHNVITAEIVVENGKIISHRDHFSFWRWSRQALGFPGLLLGWTPIIKSKVRREAEKGLRHYIDKS